jgi:hypothetical protein
METQLTLGKVLSHVIGWTVLGFVVLLVIGPVFAVVGAILPFALVGFLCWAGYRGIRRLTNQTREGVLEERIQVVKEKLAPGGEWNRAARNGIGAARGRAGRLLRLPGALIALLATTLVRLPLAVLRIPLALLRLPFTVLRWVGRQAWGAASAVGRFTGRVVSGAFVQGRFAAVIMLEVFCGIAVGALLGALAEQRLSLHGDHVLTGAAVGGFLGVLVALSTPEPKRKTTVA